MKLILMHALSVVALGMSASAFAGNCSSFSSSDIDSLACSDTTAARFLDRITKAQKSLEKVVPAGARQALRNHQGKWELFADAWLVRNQSQSAGALTPRCSSPRALLFQRMDSLEKTILHIKENKPQNIDLCYDNAACLEPGASNSEMICETVYLGVEGVPDNAESVILPLLSEWTAKGHSFETHVSKATRNGEPCEIVSENTLVEYIRGGFVTVRKRQGDTCNPQNGSENIQTFELRVGRALTISDFVTSPAELLSLLKRRKEADVLQSLLRHQLQGDKTRPNIEPAECAVLPFTALDDINVHVTSDGLRVNKLFKRVPPELASCQFRVEDGLSPSVLAQLLKGKKTPASGMLRYIR
jgi:hypothetical protein